MCYAISSNDDIDECILPLSEALQNAVGFGMPSILSCCPGVLVYVRLNERLGHRNDTSWPAPPDGVNAHTIQ
jgi:hypothetical protein